MSRPITAVDLFCGAGGTSSGLAAACADLGYDLDLTAINHWQVAVETHSANHPDARHLCESMENLDPRKVWAGRGRLDILWASPECTHHSVARGGRPVNDQSRASAWHVVRWAEALRPRIVLVENVPEFRTWGPLGRNRRPIKRLKGQTFLVWLRALESLGYRVDHRILNAADYGEATTRKRLYVQAVLKGSPHWPEPTHAPESRIGFCGAQRRWRPAREVIDWSIEGRSIFGRKKPLRPRTLERIAEGLRRQGSAGEPFLVVLRRHGNGRSVEEPLPTLCAGGQHVGLAEPFVFPVTHAGGRRPRTVQEPLPTLTGAHRGEYALAEPFLVSANHGSGVGYRVHSKEDPLPTLACSNAIGVAQPFVLGQQSGSAPRQTGDPLPTVASAGAIGLVEPFLAKYYGSGDGVAPVSAPMPTVTTRDRFGLVEQVGLDIRFRMLQPHESAAAMGFPEGYRFAGSKGDRVKQIGNAVSVRTAMALCREVLS